MAVAYVISFASGYAAISTDAPFAVELRTRLLKMVATEAPFSMVINALRSRNLLLAIALTFSVNLVAGAFLSTTLLGAVPLAGAGGICLITIYRGFTLGAVYHATLTQSFVTSIVGAGTLILELSGYVFSGGAGIALSLATVFPKRHGVESRWIAFRTAWVDAAKIYLLVAALLLFGAIWEMTGLYLLLK